MPLKPYEEFMMGNKKVKEDICEYKCQSKYQYAIGF